MSKIPELDPDTAEVVRWLRSAQGQAWTRARIGFFGRLHSHLGLVYLAELIPQPAGEARMQPPDDPAEVFIDGGLL